MTTLIAALAVYKIIHVITSLLPREVMPWVKVLVGTLISFGVVATVDVEYYVLSSLAVATLAGVVHSTIRLVTYLGDMAARKATK